MEDTRRAEIAESLVRLVSLHDAETAIHMRETAALARLIAGRMDVPGDIARRIELGALLHDIGKIGVPSEVLRKRSGLSAAEWDDMRQHALSGGAILAEVPLLADLAPVIRAHHERLDGQGYPDCLSGSEIPLEARVIAVADTFHALTTDRPYRRAVGTESALDVIARAAGNQFDEAPVWALHEIFDRPDRSWRLTA